MDMPFGRHAGKPLAQIPKGYLRWLLGNAELRSPLYEAVFELVNGEKPLTLHQRLGQIMGKSRENSTE